MKDYSQIAKQYCEDVLSGKVSACKYVQQACRRHIDDLERDFEYHFDPELAHRACEFIEYMPHTKGRWAARGETIDLEPWQIFIVASVFGWLRPNGLRRFRVCYIEVPRKNAKSTLSAGVGLYIMVAEGEYGAEVYSGATTEKQAKIVFDMAKVMAKRNGDFKQLGVEVMASNIAMPETNSKFEPVVGKPGDGASPSCAIIDEYHEHASDELYDTMITGMGAREQPLMWVITTAGSDTAGPCHALRTDITKMLDGTVPNEEIFGIVYTVDKDDDWTSEAALRKANPNYDVSVSGDFLKAQVRDAINSSRKQNVVKTKHLNVWVGARESWMNMQKWGECADPSLDLEEFRNEHVWMALDLSSKVDITSTYLIFKQGSMHYFFGRHYLPEAKVDDPDLAHYAGWVHDGYLIATEGDSIDYARIKEDILRDARRFKIVALGYDPWNATQLAQELAEEGINAIEIPQNTRNLSEPMKHIEAMVLSDRVRHDGNPCHNWQVGNVTAKLDPNDNIYPRKERRESAIDGAVAMINCMCMVRTQDFKPRTKWPKGALVNL